MESIESSITASVWVVCPSCGERHRLSPGMDSPVYWCGSVLRELRAGDDVEYHVCCERCDEGVAVERVGFYTSPEEPIVYLYLCQHCLSAIEKDHRLFALVCDGGSK